MELQMGVGVGIEKKMALRSPTSLPYTVVVWMGMRGEE